MSKKYVIEIKPEYEDSFKGLMILGAKESNLFVDTLAVEDLEELNSDYINEHFSDLQDTAYQRGLDDAWEAAKKILQMYDFTVFGLEHDGVFESPLNEGQQMTPQEAIEKLKAYEEQKADDEIKVGDEVRWGEDLLVVTRFYENGGFNWCDGISKDGRAFHVLAENVSKTNRRFDIDKILEEMQG